MNRILRVHDLIGIPVFLTHTTKTKNNRRTGAQKTQKETHAGQRTKINKQANEC